MSNPVITPRYTYPRLSDLARVLGARVPQLYPYLIPARRGYALRPLDEDAYARWRERHGYQEALDA